MCRNGVQSDITKGTFKKEANVVPISPIGKVINSIRPIPYKSIFNIDTYRYRVISPMIESKLAGEILSKPPIYLKSFNFKLLSSRTFDQLNSSKIKALKIFKQNENSIKSNVPTDSITSSSTSLTIKPLHILLVTETWSPDVNGVAMSLGQLMKQLAISGHKVSLLKPKPNSNPKQFATTDNHSKSSINKEGTSFKPTGLKPTGKEDSKEPNYLSTIEANNADSSAVIDNTATIEKIAPKFISHEIHVKGIAIPKYTDLQFGLPAYFSIKKSLKHLRPDIVHIATEGPLGLAALLAAKKLEIPVTTGYHTQFHDFSRHFGLGILAGPLMAYFKWFHNASKATCVPSQKTFKDLDNLGFKRLVEVGRGVDLELFNPEHRSQKLREQWGVQNHQTVLIMVSRLSPEKGVDLVIKSFKALQRQQLHRAVKLIIVGDGPDKQRLEALAADNSEDILFAGSKTGLELSQHYASGDAFVFASQVETFGNVVVEAMASGLPVYAFDDAAAGMLVKTNNGQLVEMNDKQAFIEMVASLPKMQVLKDQGCHAAQSVAEFSWQRPAEHMLAMFKNAINNPLSIK